MALSAVDSDFPCSLVITVPLPTQRLALSALRALQVDAELSSLVRRSFSLTTLNQTGDGDGYTNNSQSTSEGQANLIESDGNGRDSSDTVLRTEYKATTNRMLRVAVNGFMESLGVVLAVMEELDVDVLADET